MAELRYCSRCEQMVARIGVHACARPIDPIEHIPSPNVDLVSPNTGVTSPNMSPNGWSRNKRWRKLHPEHHRNYMREYMRKRRKRVTK